MKKWYYGLYTEVRKFDFLPHTTSGFLNKSSLLRTLIRKFKTF